MSTENPFAKTGLGEGSSIAFGGKTPEGGIYRKTVGTFYKIKLTKLPSKIQSRNFDDGKPLFWGSDQGSKTTEPNDKPIMSVVCNGIVLATNDTFANAQAVGDEASLWTQIPSSGFAAIGDAINDAKVPAMEVGGELTITLTGFKQGENKQRAAASQFSASYSPPNAFEAEAVAATPTAAAAPAPVGPPPPTAAPAAPTAPPVAEAKVDGFTKEQWIASGYTAAHFAADPKFAAFLAPAAPPAPPAKAAEAPVDIEQARAAAMAKLSPEDRALLYPNG